MSARISRLVLALALVIPGAVAEEGDPRQADAVKLRGKPPFVNVAISDFRDGILVFRGVSGEYLRKPIAEAEWLHVAAAPDFSQAEQCAARGFWPGAVDAYRRALDSAPGGWERPLTLARLARALEENGQFDEAVARWIDLATASPASSASLRPRRFAPPGSAANAGARAALLRAADAAPTPELRDRFNTWLLELLIYDEIDPTRAGFVATAASQPDFPASAAVMRGAAGSKQTAAGASAPPRLFGDRPESRRPGRSVRLALDSQLLAHADERLAANEARGVASLLERSVPFVAEDALPGWRVALARARVAAGDAGLAAEELTDLLRAGVSGSVVYEARYQLAYAKERLHELGPARAEYRALLENGELSAELRARVEDALRRIGE